MAAAAGLHQGLRPPWLSSGTSCLAWLGARAAARQGANRKPSRSPHPGSPTSLSLPQLDEFSGLFRLIYSLLLSIPEKEVVRVSPKQMGEACLLTLAKLWVLEEDIKNACA